MWLALQAPAVLLPACWLLLGWFSRAWLRWVWIGLAIAGAAALCPDLWAVASGSHPWTPEWISPQIAWAGLAAALIAADNRRTRAHFWSFGLAVAFFALEAWLPAFMLLVTGHAERSAWLRGGLSSLILAHLLGRHLSFRAFDWLGLLSLSTDTTMIVISWSNGLAVLASWILIGASLRGLSQVGR